MYHHYSLFVFVSLSSKKDRPLLIDVIAFSPTTPTMRRSRFSYCWRWCCLHVLLGIDGACVCKSQLLRGKFSYIKKENCSTEILMNFSCSVAGSMCLVTEFFFERIFAFLFYKLNKFEKSDKRKCKVVFVNHLH